MERLFNWVEILVKDMARATRFYAEILGGATLRDVQLGQLRYALFPTADTFNAGALARGTSYEPSERGVVVYLNGGRDFNRALNRVAAAGGRILAQKTKVSSEADCIGLFLDLEGTRIGLHNPV